MIDEDPSEEDIERLSHDTAYCPTCGAEIWDQADVCPKCRHDVGGLAPGRTPLASQWRRKWLILIILALLAALALIYVL